MEPLEIARKARDVLLSKKGEETLIFDIRGVSQVTDYYVITSGLTSPQLKAMMNGIQKELKQSDVNCHHRSGVPEDGWIVLDYLDVVIHIFQKELRDYYAIEELWAGSLRVK